MSGLGQGHLHSERPEAWLGIKKARMKNKVREEKKWKRGKGEGEFQEKQDSKSGEGERLKAYSPQVPLGGSMTCSCSCSNPLRFWCTHGNRTFSASLIDRQQSAVVSAVASGARMPRLESQLCR